MADQTKRIVQVGADKGWLRLRWTYLGKRYALILGLPGSNVNKTVAQQRAHQIELDIASGHFDLSLKRYKPQHQRLAQITAVKLFRLFAEEKAKQVYQRSLEKYRATVNYLAEYFQDKPAQISESAAEECVKWLSDRYGQLVLKERIGLLKACWEWGQKKGLVVTDPWIELARRIKIPPKQMPKPFTREEIVQSLGNFTGGESHLLTRQCKSQKENQCFQGFGLRNARSIIADLITKSSFLKHSQPRRWFARLLAQGIFGIANLAKPVRSGCVAKTGKW